MKCAANTFGSRMWSAQPDRRGGNSRGEQDPRARCSPCTRRPRPISLVLWPLAVEHRFSAKPFGAGQLRQSKTGGDLCRPLNAERKARRSLRGLWRERPRLETPLAARPAARAWSLTPQHVGTDEIYPRRDLTVVTTMDRCRVRPRCSPRLVRRNQRAMSTQFEPCRRVYSAHKTTHPRQAACASHCQAGSRDERDAVRVRALPGRVDRLRPERSHRHHAGEGQGIPKMAR